MLLRLARTRLAPYKRPIAAIVTLQLIGTLAMLYLPSLNAEIIDKGVVTGDTDFIIQRGGVMLAPQPDVYGQCHVRSRAPSCAANASAVCTGA